jgi:hypothetical protein
MNLAPPERPAAGMEQCFSSKVVCAFKKKQNTSLRANLTQIKTGSLLPAWDMSTVIKSWDGFRDKDPQQTHLFDGRVFCSKVGSETRHCVFL